MKTPTKIVWTVPTGVIVMALMILCAVVAPVAESAEKTRGSTKVSSTKDRNTRISGNAGLRSAATATRAVVPSESVPAVSAQEVEITSLSQNGVMTWANIGPNATCRVEWASTLTSGWKSDWASLQNIVVTNDPMTASVPMLYRVLCTPNLAEGLVAYYPFNGNANDESGNGRNGTASDAVLSKDRFGADGKAYEFNGTNSQITVNGLSFAGTDFSIAFWSKRMDTNINHFVISHGSWGSQDQGMHVGYRADSGKFTFGFYLDDLDTPDTHLDVDNAWHFWTVTYQTTSRARKIYKDGLLVASGTASGDYMGSGTFYIGRGWNTGWVMHGMMDDVRVYNRVLFPYEILALAGSPEVGLTAYYPFNGNATDETGNGHDGTISGAGLTQDRFGVDSKSYSFDGTNSQITVNGLSFAGTDFSIAFWSKRMDTNINHFVISHGSWGSQDQGMHVGYRADSGKFTFGFYLDDLDTPDTHLDVDNTWHMWTVTFDATTRARKIYRDGIQVGADTASGDYAGSGTFYIGRGWNTGRVLHGMMDEVRVYSRILWPAEVLSLTQRR